MTSRCARSLRGRCRISAQPAPLGRPSPGEAWAWCGAARRPRAAAPAVRRSLTPMERPSKTSQPAKPDEDQIQQTTGHGRSSCPAAASIAAAHSPRQTFGTPQAEHDARWRADAGTLAGVRVVITEIAWDGSIRRLGARHRQSHPPRPLRQPHHAGPGHPPALPGDPGRPVYILHASDRAVVMGEDNLVGSLLQLVTTVLEAGDLRRRSALAATGAATDHLTPPVISTEGCGQGTPRPSYASGHVRPGQPGYSDEQLAHLSGARAGRRFPAPAPRSRKIAGPGGSCVSKRVKAPELVAARLNPAMACERGSPKLPIASHWPNQVLRHLHHPSAADPKPIRSFSVIDPPAALGFESHGP